MTVLQVCAFAAPYEGNFIKSLKALGQDLSEKGHKMIYAFPESAKNIGWCKKLAEETDVYFLPLAKARLKVNTYKSLVDIYKRYDDLQIIHSHFELYDVPVTMTAPKSVRVFWHLHDALEVYNSLRYRIEHKVQYGLLHKKAELLAVAKKLMTYVLKCGFPESQAKYVPNGLDLNRINKVGTSVESRKYDFMIFGWDYEIKGVDLAIKAALKTNADIKIAVVASKQTAEIIEQQFGKLNILDVLDPVKDVNKLYEDTKCFLHISRAEGLSYALLEAVYAGLPVICSDIDENKFADVFPTVTMTKAEDIKSIASAMRKSIENLSVDASLINESRSIIEREYSISCWVSNILKLYGV